MPIEIRPIQTLDDFVQVEDVQREIWSDSETQIVPRHLINVTAHSGGAVIGAFDGERLIGFVYSFIGTDEHEPRRPAMAHLKHCSHMLAVLPDYRGHDLGLKLKLAQRDFVNKQGIRLVSDKPIPSNQTFRLWVDVPKENAPRQRIHLEAESLWSGRDVNPDFYDTGFRLQNISTQSLLQLQLLIEEFKF